MIRAARPINRFVDKTKAEELRSKLLMYRFKKVFEPISKANPLDLPDGRLVELFIPLLEVAPTPEKKKLLENWAKQTYQTILKEEKTQAAARIFEVIVDLLPAYGETIPIGKIAEKLNQSLHETEKQWQPNTISRIIGDKLGFERDVITIEGKRTRCVLIERSLLGKLMKRYMPERLETYSETQKTEMSLKEALEQVKNWLVMNRDDDGLVDAAALSEEIKRLGFEPEKVIKILLDEYFIFEVNKVGKFGVKS
jgi:hypothetical protein